MINDLKLGFHVIKYAYGRKTNILGTIIMFPVGLLLYIAGGFINNSFLSGYFFCLSIMFLSQMTLSVSMANITLASPMKKRLQTRVLAAMNTFGMLCIHTLMIVLGIVFGMVYPEKVGIQTQQILMTVIFCAIIMIYTAMNSKIYIIGTILFLIMFLTVYFARFFAGDAEIVITGENSWADYLIVSVIGYAVILLCGVLTNYIYLALYKLPIFAKSAALRKSI